MSTVNIGSFSLFSQLCNEIGQTCFAHFRDKALTERLLTSLSYFKGQSWKWKPYWTPGQNEQTSTNPVWKKGPFGFSTLLPIVCRQWPPKNPVGTDGLPHLLKFKGRSSLWHRAGTPKTTDSFWWRKHKAPLFFLNNRTRHSTEASLLPKVP